VTATRAGIPRAYQQAKRLCEGTPHVRMIAVQGIDEMNGRQLPWSASCPPAAGQEFTRRPFRCSASCVPTSCMEVVANSTGLRTDD
jgi:hypothetical protein